MFQPRRVLCLLTARLEIHDKGLCRRGPQNKQYWGHREVLLLIRHALSISKDTRADERTVKLQHVCLILIMFYIAARPGSLAPSCTDMLEHGQFCKVGDVAFTITNTVYDSTAVLTISNWKVRLRLFSFSHGPHVITAGPHPFCHNPRRQLSGTTCNQDAQRRLRSPILAPALFLFPWSLRLQGMHTTVVFHLTSELMDHADLGGDLRPSRSSSHGSPGVS